MTTISRLHIVLASLLIFVATMMAFVNSVNASFVNWDDDVYVTENPHAHLSVHNIRWIVTHPYYYSWIPITLVSHSADVALWGLSPKGHHFTNVLLHSLNAVFLFLVSIIVIKSAGSNRDKPDNLRSSVLVGSFIAALLFAFHPLRVESVAWVSGRKDLLCALFLLPSFGSYLIWKQKQRKSWLLVSYLLFALSLLSKPMALPFPIILLLTDIWLLRSKFSVRKLFSDKIVYFVLASIAGIIAALSASGGNVQALDELNVLQRFLFPFYVMVFYLIKIVAPFGLSPIYPDLSTVVFYLSPAIVAALLYASIRLAGRKNSVVALALFIYGLILLPTFFGLSSGSQPLADRYSYLASMSLFVLVAGGIELIWEKSAVSPGKKYQRELFFAVLLLICALSAYRSIRQISIWKDSVSLWSQALLYAPESRESYERGKPYLKPDYVDAALNLSSAYDAVHKSGEAIAPLRKIVSWEPCSADAHYNLGNLHFETGKLDSSLADFRRAIACDPAYAKAYYNEGILLANKDSVQAALEAFQTSARLGYAEAQILLKQRGFTW